MDALYKDAIDNLEGYEVSNVDATLFSALDIASVDVHQLENFLQSNKEVSLPNGHPAIGIEHSIDTGNHEPTSVAPYRLSSAKTEIEP